MSALLKLILVLVVFYLSCIAGGLWFLFGIFLCGVVVAS
jgi:hypothetical protein